MSIDFPTAKELKGAGYPSYGLNDGEVFCFSDSHEFDYCIEGCRDCHKDRVYKYRFIAPTLSELIEACGDEFLELALTVNGGWLARGRVPGYDEVAALENTPEEAVARLWVALQKEK